MQVVRLVKTSDLQQVTELIKKTGIGMTTMPKNRKEVQERIDGLLHLQIKKVRILIKILIYLYWRMIKRL